MAKETQEFIVDKAQPLFYRYGIRSVTMDFIASELGMSKRTLYENFENKEALIIACMEKDRKAQEQDMCAIFNSDANIIEKLLNCYNHIMYHINRTSRSFQLDVELMHSKASEEAELHREKQYSYIRDILQEGVEDGLIRADIDIDIATMFHNSQMEWFRKSQQYTNKEWGLSDILRTMVQIFLYGIVTDKGRKVLDDNKELITQIL